MSLHILVWKLRRLGRAQNVMEESSSSHSLFYAEMNSWLHAVLLQNHSDCLIVLNVLVPAEKTTNKGRCD